MVYLFLKNEVLANTQLIFILAIGTNGAIVVNGDIVAYVTFVTNHWRHLR